MQMIRLGSRIINVEHVAMVEIHDDGLTLFFVGGHDVSGKPLQVRLFNPEAIALLARLEKVLDNSALRR